MKGKWITITRTSTAKVWMPEGSKLERRVMNERLRESEPGVVHEYGAEVETERAVHVVQVGGGEVYRVDSDKGLVREGGAA